MNTPTFEPPERSPVRLHTGPRPVWHYLRLYGGPVALLAALGHVINALTGALVPIIVTVWVMALPLTGWALVALRHRVDDCDLCQGSAGPVWRALLAPGHLLTTRRVFLVWFTGCVVIALGATSAFALAQMTMAGHVAAGGVTAMATASIMVLEGHQRFLPWCGRCPSTERARGLEWRMRLLERRMRRSEQR